MLRRRRPRPVRGPVARQGSARGPARARRRRVASSTLSLRALGLRRRRPGARQAPHSPVEHAPARRCRRSPSPRPHANPRSIGSIGARPSAVHPPPRVDDAVVAPAWSSVVRCPRPRAPFRRSSPDPPSVLPDSHDIRRVVGGPQRPAARLTIGMPLDDASAPTVGECGDVVPWAPLRLQSCICYIGRARPGYAARHVSVPPVVGVCFGRTTNPALVQAPDGFQQQRLASSSGLQRRLLCSAQ